MRHVGRFRARALFVLPLLACGDADPTQPPPPQLPPPPVPTSITVSPPIAVLRQGDTLQFTATARDQYDQAMVGTTATWRSSDPSTATVDETGLVTAVQWGRATITATVDALTAMAAVTVNDRLADREVLVGLYEATNGTGWKNGSNWLSDAPLADWYGVDVDADGRVSKLVLAENGLQGQIPAGIGSLTRLTELYLNDNMLLGPIRPEIGRLSELRALGLWSNHLSGSIPSELGNLAALKRLRLEHNVLRDSIPPGLGRLSGLDTLSLWSNNLSGPIPPELGELSELRILYLGHNDLTGPIPPEIGNLSRLTEFYANRNDLTGSIPPEIGKLSELQILGLWSNDLAGSIPSELGNLGALTELWLEDNDLTGPIPASLGNLTLLEHLSLAQNYLSGPVPAELSSLVALRELYVNANTRLSGFLPTGLKDLGHLTTLHAGGTSLCAPPDPDFRVWLWTLQDQRVARCERDASPVYLTQAVQSLEFPVPLVADRSALLRVFLTAPDGESVPFPPVRARFYLGAAEVHRVDIPGAPGTVPSRVEEGRLETSADVAIPAEVLQPGLELVVQVDPDETLGLGNRITRRIPETGRQVLDVRVVPPLQLTYLPVFGTDAEFIRRVQNLTQDDRLFQSAREWLPVADFTLVIKDFVFSRAETGVQLLREIEAIRVLEGGAGYYMGGLPGDLVRRLDIGGRALLSGWSSIAALDSTTVAHELGHNMSLRHAPCGFAPSPDPAFPTSDGTTAAWGFDSSDSSLVAPDTPDLMSYCRPRWIGDFSFSKAFGHRLHAEDGTEAASTNAARTILLWGGADSDGVPFLEPAFVVDAPPTLPRSTGPYVILGTTAEEEELFSLHFDMQEMADGDGESGFALALPASPMWADRLAAIVLVGPGGTATLSDASGPPAALLRDPQTRRVRGILRDFTSLNGGLAALAGAAADPASIASILPDVADLEVLISRGLPAAEQWRR